MEHMDSDELPLFSADCPHWQFAGAGALPAGLSPSPVRKVTADNPPSTYARSGRRSSEGDGAVRVQASARPLRAMVGRAQPMQAFLASVASEGAFERFPGFRLVLIGAGFGRLPSLARRPDKLWHRLRVESAHLKRLPSDCLRQGAWLTTQPMEEPATRAQVPDAIDRIGWDRLLFATDHPQRDQDDPASVLPLPLVDDRKRAFLPGNALSPCRPQ